MKHILVLGFLLLLFHPTVLAAVPPPSKPTSDYLVGSFYFPIWRFHIEDSAADNGWLSIKDIPERKPLLGYFDEGNPEVMDWEIKWAVEHGVNFFIFLWNRCDGGYPNSPLGCSKILGKPIEIDKLPNHYALHEGYLKANLRGSMNFSLMIPVTNLFNSQEDLENNVMPFLSREYFSKGNYLKLNGKPVIYLWEDFPGLIKKQGGTDAITQAGIDKTKALISSIRQAAKNHGYPDLIIIGHDWSYVTGSLYTNSLLKNIGLDYGFSYVTPTGYLNGQKIINPTETQAIASQKEAMEKISSSFQLPVAVTASPFWDSRPYNFDRAGSFWYSSPAGYKQILQNAKAAADKMKVNMVIVDAWNEYGEGHFVAPAAKYGFGYLQAVREVLTRADNTPDYRLPSELNMGPYDSIYRSYSDQHIRQYTSIKNQTIEFKQPDDYIDVENYGFKPYETDKLSFGGWFKWSLSTPTNSQFSKPFSAAILIGNTGNGHCVVGTKNNSWYSAGTTVSWPDGLIKPNTWHHILCVYNGSNVSVYIDGVKKATSANPISGTVNTRTFRFRIGYYNQQNWQPGSVSAIRFANVAATDAQVANLYATTKPATGKPGDLTGDGKVDIFDYNELLAKFGNPYTIFDYNTLIANYGR